MARACSSCATRISRNCKSGLCVSCGAKKRYSDPAQRQAMSELKRAALQDPAKRARVARAAAENLRAWHRTTDRDWSAWHRERRTAALSWCPPERVAEYTALRRMRGVGAAEARRMIEETIPGTRAHGAREVANNSLRMRLKHERERREAY